MRGSRGSQGRTDPGRSAVSGGQEVAVRPGRRFSDAPPGCGLPAAWSGGDLGDLGVFRSLAALPLNPVFFHTPLWLRQVTSPLSLFSHLQSRDRNRAHVTELRGCSEVMWLPRLAQRLLCYGIFIIFLRLLPTSFLLPPFFALFQHTLPELSFLPNG